VGRHKPEGNRHPAEVGIAEADIGPVEAGIAEVDIGPAEVGIAPVAAQHSAEAPDTGPAAEVRRTAVMQRALPHSVPVDFAPAPGPSTRQTED